MTWRSALREMWGYEEGAAYVVNGKVGDTGILLNRFPRSFEVGTRHLGL